jgi:hypothetical protein
MSVDVAAAGLRDNIIPAAIQSPSAAVKGMAQAHVTTQQMLTS